MAERFLEEEEHADHAHPRAGPPAPAASAASERMVVTGPAGSGKTMLAVEHAKSLAAEGQGRAVRLLQQAAPRPPAEDREGLRDRVQHVPRPLRGAGEAGRGAALGRRRRRDDSARTSARSCRRRWSSAIEKLGPQYDALFVDEAQDLHNDWLDALIDTLRDPDEALVWLFMDDNQRVYENRLEVPNEFRPFDLIVNCRNTQAIHREVMKKYEGEVKPEAVGPEGREVELFQTDDQPGVVRQTVERLCEQEEVLPQDIVVLSSHSIEKSEVAQAGCGKYEFVDEPEADRRLHPLRLDPRLQGTRVAGRDPLRARGHRRRDDRPAALRRLLAGPEPLRRGGAGVGPADA